MANEPNVQILLNGCLQGDRKSQLGLYRHYFSYGMGVCLRYSKDREEALEILNDGFLKAFLKIDRYDTEKPFRPWLRRVLINTAIEYYRKYHQGKEVDLQNVKFLKSTSTYNDALDQLAYDDLLALVQQLPPAYRMVFNLYVMEQRTHQEIAEELDISVGTSKSNLSKARRKIQSMLGESHGIHLKPAKHG